MRLNKYLAKAGIASRRKCDQFIENKKIMINGETVTNFGYRVKSEDIVTFEGKVVSEHSDVIYILNKPKGYVCSNKEEFKNKTVFDLIDSDKRLFTIGRLDRDTTGLLLITNNGDLSYKLTHPKFEIERRYYVVSNVDIDMESCLKLKKGIRLEDGMYVKADLKKMYREKNEIYWDISLNEGKNREIKKIFLHFESKVIALHRYRFANIELKSLKVGKYRKMNNKEFDFLNRLSI